MQKPEVSIPAGLVTAALVYAIFQQATPSYVDLRVNEPNDTAAASAERMATWTAIAAVSGISLLAKDPVIFMIGGIATLALAWSQRHGNAVDPTTGTAVPRGSTPNPQMPADLAYDPA
jgi:hypothetical protein